MWSGHSKTDVDGRLTWRCPPVIVVGNEKGGSGKSTVAMHLAIALIKSGQAVATIDLDTRQKVSPITSKTGGPGHDISAVDLNGMPQHFCSSSSIIPPRRKRPRLPGAGEDGRDARRPPWRRHYRHARSRRYLTRVAHAMADTLITPLNDSFRRSRRPRHRRSRNFSRHRHPAIMPMVEEARAPSPRYLPASPLDRAAQPAFDAGFAQQARSSAKASSNCRSG